MRDVIKEISNLYDPMLDSGEKEQMAAALKGDKAALEAIKGWSKKIAREGKEIWYVMRYDYFETSDSNNDEVKHFINLMDAIGALKSLIDLYSFSDHAMKKIADAFDDDEFYRIIPKLFIPFDKIGHNYPLETVKAAKAKNPEILKRFKADGGSFGFLSAMLLDEQDPELALLLDEALKEFMAGDAKADRAIFSGLVVLDGKNAAVNKILIKYTENNPDKVIGALIDAFGQVKHKVAVDLYLVPNAMYSYNENTGILFNYLKDFFHKTGLNNEFYVSYLFSYALVDEKGVQLLFDLYGKDYELIRKVIPAMTPRGQIEASVYLAIKGEDTDLKKVDEHFIATVKPSDRVRAWLQNGTGEIPDGITNDDINFLKPALYLAGKILSFSDVAIRYLNALMKREWQDEDRGYATSNEVGVQNIFAMYEACYKNASEYQWLSKVDLTAVLWNMAWYYNGENPNRSKIVYAIIEHYPEAVKKGFTGSADRKIYIVNHLTKDFEGEFLLSLLSDKSKKVADRVCKLLLKRKDLIPEFKKLTEAKKKTVREYAEKLLAEIGGDTEDLFESAAVKKATGDQAKTKVVKTETKFAITENFEPKEYYKKYAKTIDKVIAWTMPDQWIDIRLADSGEPADKDTIKYYVYQFINSKDINQPPNTKNIATTLHKSDLNKLSVDIYNMWLETGAGTKQKGVLALYCVNASESDIGVLKKQIDCWAENGRTAIASEALKSMLLSDTELAWMTVGNISKKYKYKSVKGAALQAIDYAAKTLGISKEEMVDRTTPSLGFNQRGEKEIDFGTRKFTAFLTPDLKVELTDETGKKLRSLPKPGKTDDITKAEIAKKDLVTLKKSLEEIVKNQTVNLEKAIGSRRMWTQEGWRGLFEKNPIMHIFAGQLVWGFYSNDTLAETFVYSDDGSIVNNEGDCLEFKPDTMIGLVHPLELSKEKIGAWREYLDDLDIHTQPVIQLDRPVFRKSDYKGNVIDVFGGKMINALSLVSRLSKRGWYKNFYEYDSFKSMCKTYKTYNAVIHHNFLLLQVSYTNEAILGFLNLYNQSKEEDVENIPDIFFSEVMYDLTVATEKAHGFDEEWRKKEE